LSQLHAFLKRETGLNTALDFSLLRNHSGYTVRTFAVGSDEKGTTVLKLQCRSLWLGKTARYDDVAVEYQTEAGETEVAYARLLAFLSYQQHQLAFLWWYEPVIAVPARQVSISAGYLRVVPPSSATSTDIVYAASIRKRVHLISDLQHPGTGTSDQLQAKRFFINELNELCL
jgi:hypothetical protein